ncbi:hypothetical protein ACTXT7_004187 [Hymenolepis weldensis]
MIIFTPEWQENITHLITAVGQDCLSVTQTICPITSSSEAVTASIGHPIFISTSPNPTITPAPPSTAYSTSSNGSAFLGSDGDKISLDGRRKRPAPSIASTRHNNPPYEFKLITVHYALDTANIVSPRKVRTSREVLHIECQYAKQWLLPERQFWRKKTKWCDKTNPPQLDNTIQQALDIVEKLMRQTRQKEKVSYSEVVESQRGFIM